MISVRDLSRMRSGDAVESAATIVGLPGRERERRVWIRTRAKAAGSDDASLDGSAWLVAMLPSAVCLGRPIEIEGTVSERLLANCERAMEVWRRWWRWVRPVEIRPAAVHPDTRRPRRVGCFFSGGVDSSYSVAKSLQGIEDPPISELILVHGFDIALDHHELRASVSSRLRAAATELDLPLVEVETNLRSVVDRFADWGRLQHGPLLAALGLVLSGRYGRIVIPATNTRDTVFPWASHPELDPLWSTEATEFVHDGLEADRVQKVEVIARSQPLLSALRVCHRNPDGAYNCGRCEKCLRTKVNLIAAGISGEDADLGRPAPELVAGARPVDHHIRLHARDNLAALERRGIEPELQRSLRRLLRRPISPRGHYRWAVFRARMARYRLGLPR